MTLVSALGLERARLISLCGAGGKTTLMFAIGRELVAAGRRVLLTTTTRIAAEEAEGPWPLVVARDPAEALGAALRAVEEAPGGRRGGAVVAVSGPAAEGTKYAGFPPGAVDGWKAGRAFDHVLVEADGAARRPLKAPAAHEPVVPLATDVLVMVAGLDGLGRPLDERTVFRSARWAELTGLAAGAPVTAESLAAVVVHPDGLGRGCPAGARRVLFLNRADTPARRAAARRIRDALAAAPHGAPGRAVAGRLLPTPSVGDPTRFRSRTGLG